MKHLLVFLLLFPSVLSLSQTPEHEGKWYGEISINGQGYPVVLYIYQDSIKVSNKDDLSNATVSTKFYFENDSLSAYWKPLKANLNSTAISKDTIWGLFDQMGQQFDVYFTRNPIAPKKYKRPQTPSPPYPYDTAAVSVTSLDGTFDLSGTLIEVNQEVAVIFASGSGPQNRNSTIMKHHPFWVISDYLAKKSISSLRMDDRGFAKSGGKYQQATTEDFANDIIAAAEFLHQKGFKKIGVIGHSEGGLTAPLAASKSKKIDFVILLAPPGVQGKDIITKQSELIMAQKGVDSATISDQIKQVELLHKVILSQENYQDTLRNTLIDIYEESKAKGEKLPEKNAFIMQNMMIYSTPWYRYFISYNPIPTIEKLKIPVGIIQGEKDIQVDPNQNIRPLKKALKNSKSKNYHIEVIPNLNHLLQYCKTGAVEEYVNIEQTIAPIVLELIVKWTKEFSQ